MGQKWVGSSTSTFGGQWEGAGVCEGGQSLEKFCRSYV